MNENTVIKIANADANAVDYSVTKINEIRKETHENEAVSIFGICKSVEEPKLIHCKDGSELSLRIATFTDDTGKKKKISITNQKISK